MDSFEYKKSLGQNFLRDDNILRKIVDSSEIDNDTLVIEVGPGAGSLSKLLIPKAGFAILFEIDVRLKEKLDSELGQFNNYEIIFGDFLKQDISNIRNKYNYKKIYVVANLPYYITTPIITKLMTDLYPERMIIMIQEEVADRLSAEKGNRIYGMISVLLGAKYRIKKLFKVSRKCFYPQPNVDSAVISLDKYDSLGNTSYSKFESFIKDAFRYKRKTLKNNLSKYDLVKIQNILDKYGYSLNNRAEAIPVSVYVEIVNNI